MYNLAKNILFRFSPELSHELALDWMGAAGRLGLIKLLHERPRLPVNVMGIDFPNPVGLAAGLDKNGDYYHALGALGFGFVEIGTVTPLPQSGNPQPRLFRLADHKAIINRMGFNNKGVEHLVEQVKKRRFDGVLGINIGKNKQTPDADALADYCICMEAVYPYADYITVNISSPNTPGLRSLQFGEALTQLLRGIKRRQQALADNHGRFVPIAVKIAPDMTDAEICEVADSLVEEGMNGVIATNTTVSRDGVAGAVHAEEAGGLSGAPVKEKSTHVIRVLNNHLRGAIPIIGVGGILSADDALEKIDAGASLIQLYSGFIYTGPGLIKSSVEAIKRRQQGTF